MRSLTGPVHADLLGEPLVLWRGAGGGPRVMSDLCVHRGAWRSQPAAADRCAGYVVIGRNYNTGQPDRVIREFEDTIFGQDQVVVESQRPEQVPFDLAAELHLRFDAVAVAYRKAMRELGLAAGTPIGIPAE